MRSFSFPPRLRPDPPPPPPRCFPARSRAAQINGPPNPRAASRNPAPEIPLARNPLSHRRAARRAAPNRGSPAGESPRARGKSRGPKWARYRKRRIRAPFGPPRAPQEQRQRAAQRSAFFFFFPGQAGLVRSRVLSRRRGAFSGGEERRVRTRKRAGPVSRCGNEWKMVATPRKCAHSVTPKFPFFFLTAEALCMASGR